MILQGGGAVIDVCLLGTGGMMPLPERALTSLYIRHDGKALLIDCGEGTQTAIRKAGLRFKPIDAIAITHFHADHISGLPGLLLTLGNEGRTEPLHMYGPEGLTKVVNALCVIVPELPFSIEFHELERKQETHFCCAGLNGTAFPLDHGTVCFGYQIKLNRAGKFDPQRARERGVPLEYWGRLQQGQCVGQFKPEDVLGPPRRGLSLMYATDTRPVSAMLKFGAQADLMVLEGMFGEPEKQARAIECNHMTMQEAARIAAEAEAKELWLTHYSPANPEPEAFADSLCAIFPETVIGRDGMIKTIRFAD